MKNTVYDFKNYKDYLSHAITRMPSKGRGFKSRIAAAARCQSAYVSQVLKGQAHFSLEQGHAINRLLGHTSEEAHYFLLLLQYARAGTADLRSYFQEQIRQTIERRLTLKHRLGVKQVLSLEDQAQYYSAWYYAAIHVLLTIPHCQSKEAVAKSLAMPLAQVSKVIQFLESIGLIEAKGAIYQPGPSRIHLANDSPLISKHHTNWRMKCIASLEHERPEDLHYSSVISLSIEDISQIKSMLVEAIEKIKSVVKESKEEELFSFDLDFFKLADGLPHRK